MPRLLTSFSVPWFLHPFWHMLIFGNHFLLFVDASATGIGFTLAQTQNGKEVVIAYSGRGLN